MLKSKKFLLLSLSLLVLSPLLFAEESITITTYYPSPYGSYNELQLYPHDPAVTTCDDAHKGTLFYKSTDDQVYVCKGTTLGWQASSPSLPSGFCIFSDTQNSCPAGWTRRTQFDGRTIRGAAIPGGTGGNDDLTLAASTTPTCSAPDSCIWSARGAIYSNWPPYTNVLICCKN